LAEFSTPFSAYFLIAGATELSIRTRPTSSPAERIVCRNCGKPSVPAPTCKNCGEVLQEKRSVTKSVKITATAAQILEDFSKAFFVQKDGDAGGTIELLARLGKMALRDDEDGRALREFLSGVARTYTGEEADFRYAWQKQLNFQEKRGPKPSKGEFGK